MAAHRNDLLEIVRAETDDHFELAKSLFAEYAASLNVDLAFQHFDDELSNLPAQYSPPRGRLLLAVYAGETAGGVALRRFGDDVCEMKRLYIRPRFRDLNLGRQLVMSIIEEGRTLGYGRMRLDTLPPMTRAQALYTSVGFREIAPYRFNPVRGTVFMELNLRDQDE